MRHRVIGLIFINQNAFETKLNLDENYSDAFDHINCFELTIKW